MQAGLAQYMKLHPSNKPHQGVALLPKFSPNQPANRAKLFKVANCDFIRTSPCM